MNIRYAIIENISVTTAVAYLPHNYLVLGTVSTSDNVGDNHNSVVIHGVDKCGWTLDDYVLPRLASGLYFGREINTTDNLATILDAVQSVHNWNKPQCGECCGSGTLYGAETGNSDCYECGGSGREA